MPHMELQQHPQMTPQKIKQAAGESMSMSMTGMRKSMSCRRCVECGIGEELGAKWAQARLTGEAIEGQAKISCRARRSEPVWAEGALEGCS
eukprot:scaffold228731_cov33-Tisochrysis_lutea.AAC.2